MKKLYITALVIILFSCRSKKITSETKELVKIDTVLVQQKVIDTLIITKAIEVTKPVYFETIIDCDDDQSGKVGSGGNYTQYEIKDGKILLKTNLDSVTSYWQSFYQTKFKTDSINIKKLYDINKNSQEEVVRYVYPWWFWLLGAGGILFFALWLFQKFNLSIP